MKRKEKGKEKIKKVKKKWVKFYFLVNVYKKREKDSLNIKKQFINTD